MSFDGGHNKGQWPRKNDWTKCVGRFGLVNGPECFLKACEEIKKVNSKSVEKIMDMIAS